MLSAVAVCARAEGDASCGGAAWLALADAEPLALTAAVDRMGDRAVLACLADTAPLPARVAAVRASEYLRAPEAGLVRLAELAASRDSELAPLAARRAFRIAQRLVQEGLAAREVLPAELSPARAALQRAAHGSQGAPRPRADLRLWLEQAAALLSALGVP